MTRYLNALIVVLVCTLLTNVSAQAVFATRFQLTRLLPLPVATFEFPRSAMTCNLPVGPLAAPGLRISDEQNVGRDCELLGNAGGVIVAATPGVPYRYTIQGATDSSIFGPPGEFPDVSVPTAPSGRRLRPATAPGVDFVATVFDRLPFGGYDVARTVVDGYPIEIALGALTLTVPGVYSVQRGDRVAVAIWRP